MFALLEKRCADGRVRRLFSDAGSGLTIRRLFVPACVRGGLFKNQLCQSFAAGVIGEQVP
jgi:hypothetical protein